MKSEHRHELKTNELAEWMGQLPQLLKKNYRMIIYFSVIVIVVAVISYFKIYRVRSEALHKRIVITDLIDTLGRKKMDTINSLSQGLDKSGEMLMVADNLSSTAQTIEDDKLAAMALIKRGEALRAELHYRYDTPERAIIEHQVNQARQCYEQALAKAAGHSTLTALAKYGLGLCEEEVGNFEGAETIYREIVNNDEFEGTIVPSQAQQRLDTMVDYKEDIVFVEALPKPAPAESVTIEQPAAVGPVTVEINSPG